jgi:hypothetical protein
MVDIDQRLRGEGFPNSISKRGIDGELARMAQFIDQHIQTECTMAEPEPRMPEAEAIARAEVFIGDAHKDDRLHQTFSPRCTNTGSKGDYMARSKRKTPIRDITTPLSEKKDKQSAHRRYRRTVKAVLQHGPDADFCLHVRELSDP